MLTESDHKSDGQMVKPPGGRKLAGRKFALGRSVLDTASRQASEREGRSAERLAALWLRLKGYRVLDSRVRTPVGEIDLIVQRGQMVCFVEVKHRATPEAALASLSQKQQDRISRAAAWWLSRNDPDGRKDVRFDVMAISPRHRPRHLADAWRPNG